MWHSLRRNDDGAHNEERGRFGKDASGDRDLSSNNEYETASETSEAQAGVRRIEAVSKAWTKASLIIAYVT